jgi:hypothetical protein
LALNTSAHHPQQEGKVWLLADAFAHRGNDRAQLSITDFLRMVEETRAKEEKWLTDARLRRWCALSCNQHDSV